jgi:hypothetical protein
MRNALLSQRLPGTSLDFGTIHIRRSASAARLLIADVTLLKDKELRVQVRFSG